MLRILLLLFAMLIWKRPLTLYHKRPYSAYLLIIMDLVTTLLRLFVVCMLMLVARFADTLLHSL